MNPASMDMTSQKAVTAKSAQNPELIFACVVMTIGSTGSVCTFTTVWDISGFILLEEKRTKRFLLFTLLIIRFNIGTHRFMLLAISFLACLAAVGESKTNKLQYHNPHGMYILVVPF